MCTLWGRCPAIIPSLTKGEDGRDATAEHMIDQGAHSGLKHRVVTVALAEDRIKVKAVRVERLGQVDKRLSLVHDNTTATARHVDDIEVSSTTFDVEHRPLSYANADA